MRVAGRRSLALGVWSRPIVPVRVQIRGFAHGGEGVGQAEDGMTWFVPGTLPNEVVEAESVRRKARWARGRLTAVVEASPDRVTPPCPLAGRCGGCDWQHVAAATQTEHKRTIVADQLRGVVADPAQVHVGKVLGDRSGLHYRRRARMHYRKVGDAFVMGFFAPRSREIVDAPQCPVLRPELDHALSKLRSLAPHLPDEGEAWALSDGRVAALALPGVRPDDEVVAAVEAVLDDRFVGVLLRGGRRSRGVGQPELVLDEGDGLVGMKANPFVFSQANAAVNRAMVRHVMLAARCDGMRVLELYAGAGNLSRALAKTARRVWTVDDDRDATRLLLEQAEQEQLAIKARHGSAPNLLRKLAENQTEYDVVVVDPPRRGLGEKEAGYVAKVAEKRIVYVSCDPATLARDLRVMVDRGFRLVDVTVFDMMPMTAEVETVATLERVSPR